MNMEEIKEEIQRMEERIKDRSYRSFGFLETFSDETYEALTNIKLSKIKAQINALEEIYKEVLTLMANADSLSSRPMTAKEKYNLVSGCLAKSQIIF